MTNTENTPIIEFKDVVKTFDDKVILEGLSFKVFQGETFCIIGGSGTGKSVTLKLLLGLIPFDDGEIYFKGEPLSDLTEDQLNKMRQHIGMVFQGSALFDSMTVYENIAYPLEERYDYDEAKLSQIVDEKLDLVRLKEAVDLYPADLSGGMKKRVGVARALATDPDVILYDEPTAGLDPTNVKRVDNLIKRLQKDLRVTSVLVTHHMPSVYEVADRVGLLYQKKMAFCGLLHDFKKSADPIVTGFIQGIIGD